MEAVHCQSSVGSCELGIEYKVRLKILDPMAKPINRSAYERALELVLGTKRQATAYIIEVNIALTQIKNRMEQVYAMQM